MLNPLILKSLAIKHYSKKNIAKAIVEESKNREVAVKYQKGFGNRPNILESEAEIYNYIVKGATSFHISEELYFDPLEIKTSMDEKKYKELLIGWDFILDVDSPDWDFSKTVAYLLVKSLEDFNIKNIRVKFSGNKGFHIGVPFESFPKKVFFNNEEFETKKFFPELPRAMTKILINYIEEELTKITSEGKILFDNKISYTTKELEEKLDIKDLTIKKCTYCKKTYEENFKVFQCSLCGFEKISNNDYEICPKCNIEMKIIKKIEKCSFCGNEEFYRTLNIEKILHLDTLLISNRHLFRSAYSLNEKSGLVSIPINKNKILLFERHYAKPEYIENIVPFITQKVREESSESEGKMLVEKAISLLEQEKSIEEKKYKSIINSEFKVPEKAIKEEFWPPCVKNILQGLKDGKKRSLFILLNFLRSIGWDRENVEKIIYAWNEKNLEKGEKLRETYIKSQINYAFRNKIVLPPNCDNKDYYHDLQVCTPDNFCSNIKNPVQYAIKKSELKSKKRKRKTKKETKEKEKIQSTEKEQQKEENMEKKKEDK